MSDLNRKLSIVAAVLVVLAVLTYLQAAGRTEGFESGQRFLPNLDPDDIAEIVLTGTGSTTTLRREGDRFTVSERSGYAARNDEVNGVVRGLIDTTLDRRMGRGGDLGAELGLEGGDESVSVVLRNAGGEEMVSLRLGDSTGEGGRYVQRLDGEDQAVYRTEGALDVPTDPGRYLDLQILDHAAAAVVRVEGPDFVLARERDGDGGWQGELELEGAGATAADAARRVAGLLSRFDVEEVHVADDPTVSGLAFDRTWVYLLDDESGYRIEVAEGEDGTYARLTATFGVDRLEVGAEETDDELREKADVLRRSDEVATFNEVHGPWVYRLAPADAEVLELGAVDLREDG